MIKTFQYKIKTGRINSSDCRWLSQKASSINYIWNYCNDAQKHKLKWESQKKWLSGFDLSSMCSGVSKEIGLHSQTVQAVCEEYANKRKAKKKAYLRYRSYKKSLGWTLLKKQVEYLAITHQSVFLEVNESFTTQACSSCGNRTGPKGLKDLGIREWKCTVCNTVHDRDVNSAKNILRIGHDTLGVGIPILTA